MIILPLFPAIFDANNSYQTSLTSALQLLNVLFDAATNCAELKKVGRSEERSDKLAVPTLSTKIAHPNPFRDSLRLSQSVDRWYFAYFMPIAIPTMIQYSYNSNGQDIPLNFVLSAGIQRPPGKFCPNVQVGIYGTIALTACPPSINSAIGDITACNSIISKFDDLITSNNGKGYFDLATGGNAIRQTAIVSAACYGSPVNLKSIACEAIEGPDFGFAPNNIIRNTSPEFAYSTFAMYNFTSALQFAALMNIIGRIILLVMIWFFSGVLQADARQLVIKPLTRLLDIVFYYVRNPLAPTRNSAVDKVKFDR